MDLLVQPTPRLLLELTVSVPCRYKLCHMLPRLRSTIRLPTDKHLLQQLEFCVRKLLCREKDKDVVATIRKVRHRNGDRTVDIIYWLNNV